MTFQYQILADQLARKIHSSEIQPNQKLSSLRAFSKNHNVSMTTAKSCYELLESQGLIFVKPKSGYFVKLKQKIADLPTYPDFKSYPRAISNLELQNEILEASTHPHTVHLGTIQLSPKLIPTEALRKSFQRALRNCLPEDFLYSDKQGHIQLRQALSNHYAEDGIHKTKDLIFITSGCMPALAATIQLLTQTGDSIIVPMPNYNGQQLLLANLNRKIVEIPASHTGIDLARLEEAMIISGAKVCLLTANFQNPLGFCLTNDEKEKIAKLAAKYKCFIIEDDIYAECGYSIHRPRPIQYWDRDGYVFLCSSISKSLSPAYRIGWIFLPSQQEKLREKLLSLLSIVSTPLQLGLADFMNSRSYRSHLNQLKPLLMKQVEEYRLFILQLFKDLNIKITNPQGGYVLWVQLSGNIDSLHIYKLAKELKINIVPGTVFGEDQKYASFIRLNLGYPLDQSICNSLITLKNTIKEQTPLNTTMALHFSKT